MKLPIHLLALTLAAALLPFPAHGADKPAPGADAEERPVERIFDEMYQFLFFATLEGLYRDGVSSKDVEALLAKKNPKSGYLNFIYTCPICMPVQAAIETYQKRPPINHWKVANHQTREQTFGFGLPEATSEALRSEKATVCLGAVNELVNKWVSYRMEHAGLGDEQKKALIEKLKKGREDGMRALQNFARDANGPGSLEAFAPGYAGGDECAICNAALQMPVKLKLDPAK